MSEIWVLRISGMILTGENRVSVLREISLHDYGIRMKYEYAIVM
jgi:hypothetical protein